MERDNMYQKGSSMGRMKAMPTISSIPSNPIEHTIEPWNASICTHFQPYTTYIYGLNYSLIFDLIFFEAKNQSVNSNMVGIFGIKCWVCGEFERCTVFCECNFNIIHTEIHLNLSTAWNVWVLIFPSVQTYMYRCIAMKSIFGTNNKIIRWHSNGVWGDEGAGKKRIKLFETQWRG